ncbi:Hypothetical predicted protein [Pelobates cultripes]|uniref:Uncharacterized protein n=1 Tax=Pelobates cultripes TaxID=61616 RepID=A0AAD1SGR2_PELCU|nr:Hypothetical predicted protein [Pelobates cultripes]
MAKVLRRKQHIYTLLTYMGRKPPNKPPRLTHLGSQLDVVGPNWQSQSLSGCSSFGEDRENATCGRQRTGLMRSGGRQATRTARREAGEGEAWKKSGRPQSFPVTTTKALTLLGWRRYSTQRDYVQQGVPPTYRRKMHLGELCMHGRLVPSQGIG